MSYVLDASAVLALLKKEPGCARVAAIFATGDCVVGAVNWAEVVARLADSGQAEADVRATAAALGATVLAFDAGQAAEAGLLRPLTRHRGLSLGDRACLALARQRGATAITGDRAWLELAAPLGLAIECIRPAQP